jgi:Acyl-CoA carboxylase epsilon subunit
MLQIVRGEPPDEELAALIAVLAGLASAAAEPPAPRSAWADPVHRLRTPRYAGWRVSMLPSGKGDLRDPRLLGADRAVAG